MYSTAWYPWGHEHHSLANSGILFSVTFREVNLNFLLGPNPPDSIWKQTWYEDQITIEGASF